MMRWTQANDYAIAFGAALGMSAGQIGACMGESRCAVIGRAWRQKISLDPYKGPKSFKPRRPKVRRVRKDGILPLGFAARAAGLTVADLKAIAEERNKAAA